MLQSPPLMGVELGRVLCHFPMGLSCNHANNLCSLRTSSVPHAQPFSWTIRTAPWLGPTWQMDLCEAGPEHTEGSWALGELEKRLEVPVLLDLKSPGLGECDLHCH